MCVYIICSKKCMDKPAWEECREKEKIVRGKKFVSKKKYMHIPPLVRLWWLFLPIRMISMYICASPTWRGKGKMRSIVSTCEHTKNHVVTSSRKISSVIGRNSSHFFIFLFFSGWVSLVSTCLTLCTFSLSQELTHFTHFFFKKKFFCHEKKNCGKA